MNGRFLLFLSVVIFSRVVAQENPDKGWQAISVKSVEAPLSFLASDWTEGREVGTKGAYLAADYIASVFQMYGIKPMGDMDLKRLSREYRLKGIEPQSYRSYFQNFDLITETRKDVSELHLITTSDLSSSDKKLIEGVDYQINGNSGAIDLDAPVVFVGYGIKSKSLKCDPYQKVDLKGKIAVLLTGFPGMNDSSSYTNKTIRRDSAFSIQNLEKEKIVNARAAGALAVFRYNPNQKIKSANPSNLPMFSDDEYYEGDRKPDDFYLKRIRLPNWEEQEETILVQIDQHLTESILSGSGDLLKNMLQPGYDMASFKVVNLPSYRFRLQISKDSKVIRARNVLGYIEGTNPNEVVVIGAHYDHVGKYNGFIFNGADDNASGTAGMLTLARAYAESGRKPEKTIVFAAWTGEEQGLWGSKYFVKNKPDSLNVILNINMDMIGRTFIKDDSEAYLSFQYTKGYEHFEEIFKRRNETNKLNLDIRFKADKQPNGGSDFASFAKAGIPVISLFTGIHRDYHMPNDEIELINLEKMTAIIKLTYLGLNDILKKK